MEQEIYENLHDYIMDKWLLIEEAFATFIDNEDDITTITYNICDCIDENYEELKDKSYEDMYNYGFNKVLERLKTK